MKYLLYAFLLYLLYNLIFKLVIPVYLTTRKVKKGFKQMQEQMAEKMRQHAGFQETPTPQKEAPKHRAGDYIDFEEMK
jgi:hypothetical protein